MTRSNGRSPTRTTLLPPWHQCRTADNRPGRTKHLPAPRQAQAFLYAHVVSLLGGAVRTYAESAHKAAATETAAPGLAEAGALIGVLQRVGRHGVLELGERRIEDVLIAAE